MIFSRFIGVIPARGSSERLPGKNLKCIGNLSLVGRAVECARKVDRLEKIIISSDSKEILAEAKRVAGSDKRFLFHKRPVSLALNSSPMEDLLNVIMKKHSWATHCVLLNPTSPFRTSGTIDRCISAVTKLGYDSVSTVVSTKDIHYIWEKRGEKYRPPFYGKKRRPRSQELEPVLIEHGACFISSRALIEQGKLTGDKCHPVVTGRYQSVDIDDMTDLVIARSIYKGHLKDHEDYHRLSV